MTLPKLEEVMILGNTFPGETIIFQCVLLPLCHEFVLLPLVYRPSSESKFTMSTLNTKQGMVMSVLFIAKVQRTFLRGN